MKRNIVITGGAGFIGSHVVRLFVNKYPEYKIINLDKLTYAGNLANLKDIEDKPNYKFVTYDTYLSLVILNRIPFKELDEWVNDPLADDVCCLDNDNERPRLRLSDDQVWQEIIKIAGVTCSSDFQKIDKTKQREALGLLRELGASVRQLERLTGISRGVIQFVRK